MPLSTRNLYGSAQKNKIPFSNEEENGPRLKRSNSVEHFNFDDEFEEKDQQFKRLSNTQMMKLFYENAKHGIGNELKIQECFRGHFILLLWNLWEIMISEVPLLVVGTDPGECSHAVLTLLSLISPLTTQADFRPYVTVQNDDILAYHDAIKKGQVSNLILGISSPLLARNFDRFPAILRMDSAYYREKKLKDPKICELTPKILKTKSSKEISHSLLLNNGLEKV